MMSSPYTRRELLRLGGQAVLAGALAPHVSFSATGAAAEAFGAIVGETEANQAGEKVLRDGGNAIDAAVTAAFVAGVTSPSKCGVGGYGGHAMLALAGGKKITAIDFDSTAPAAARPDMFKLNEKGQVVGNANVHGWLAAGVPGTLAGLDLILKRYGTRALREVVAPAIARCEAGVEVAPMRRSDNASRNDPRPDSAQTGAPARVRQRNLPLAKLLTTLAEQNSVESFYHGEIAATIAAAFQKNGGLVTRDDLARYRARELTPLRVDWNGATVHSVPLPSTGALVLEALAILQALDWSKLSPAERRHAKLEALRLAWADRADTFGDSDFVDVPVSKFLSRAYAGVQAEKIATALRAQKPVPLNVDPSRAGGTVNISAADRHGNMIAVTLTHGGGYGAQVAVDELGMVLGHGMSRFDPRPGRPNSPGPRKRPLTNMCPAIVTRAGVPVLALGAAGGTRIPNSIYEVLVNYVGLGSSLHTAMMAPRLDTNGTLNVGLEKTHAPEDEAFFKSIGYKTSRVVMAFVSAVEAEPKTGTVRGLATGGA